MAVSSILKDIFHNSVAEGIYKEIASRSTNYYYFLGKTISWENETSPDSPIDSVNYENDVRKEIITAKQIKPTDVAFVVPRYDWKSGDVYDQYDDQYDTKLKGIDLVSGGSGYVISPTVYIGSSGAVNWSPSVTYTRRSLVKYNNRYYLVSVGGVSGETPPSHVTGSSANGSAMFDCIEVSDGNGSGASAVATVVNGSVIDITLTNPGDGYTELPSVYIADENGIGATAVSVIAKGHASRSQKLEQCVYYVVTDEYNVYKCLDNNNGSVSTVKPYGSSSEPIKLNDGYVWKFLLNIPVALRNKFLSNVYMPVVNALQNQYYSNGSIQTVRIDSMGEGYTSASIAVQGDGYLEENPVYIVSANIINSGSGYTNPTLIIESPFSNVGTWSANAPTILNQKLSHNNNIYQVTVAGTTGSSAPSHRFDTVINGTTSLKYVGTTATGTLSIGTGVNEGKIVGLSLNGSVREINTTQFGSGYISAPDVSIVGGGGTGASAEAVMRDGMIIRIDVKDPGINYTSNPNVVIGTQWNATDSVSVGDQLFYETRLYTVSVSGVTSNQPPTHTGGSQANGTASLTYAGIAAAATSALRYGAGYSSIPSAVINDINGSNASIGISVSKSEARLSPILENGQLTSVQILDGGVGYSYAALTIDGAGIAAGGTPSLPAEISADLSYGDINSLQANIELLTVDGEINNISIVSGGYDYGAATVTIDGDGTGATATAVITNGVITKINMITYGSGYRWAKVLISGNGEGASARAIISPYGGHGKNVLNELFARTLMFYSNVSLDKNQGFSVNNDYRQVGIIKAPRKYGSLNYLTATSASGCLVIAGNLDTNKFLIDSILYDGDGYRFRIVTNNGSTALIQSLDNIVPQIGQTFTNDSGDYVELTQVTLPTIDKYSGDLLFIDNKLAFTPSAEQTVTLRTVIKF